MDTLNLFFFCVFLMQLSSAQNVQSEERPHIFDAVGMIKSFFGNLETHSQIEKNDQLHESASSLLDFRQIFDNYSFDVSSLDSLFAPEDDQCFQDLMYIFQSLSNKENNWAILMLDSYGKIGSGVLQGNFKMVGDFNECKSVYAPKKYNSTAGDFHGQYCTMNVALQLAPEKSLPLSSALCLPDSCNATILKSDFQRLINISHLGPIIHKLETKVNVTSVDCQSNSKPLTGAAIFMILFLSFFVLLALIGSSITVYEYALNSSNGSNDSLFENASGSKGFLVNGDMDKGESKSYMQDEDVLIVNQSSRSSETISAIKEFFKCFCVFTNGQKLLDTSSTEGQLLCVHGIRFLSMSWVIVCHTYAFCFGTVSNIVETVKIVDKWTFQIILQGFYSVDSFFVLSGFLMAYLFFQECEKRNGKVPWLPFYLHRYIRLTPVYMIMLGFATALFPYFGSGPFWPQYSVEPVCRDNWWWNILYINNFASAEKQCVAWSWYLANDMQFFVISPLFLITLWRWPKVGYSIMGLFLCATFAANFGITYYYNLISGLDVVLEHSSNMQDFMTIFQQFFQKIYIKPYCRIGPYLVGITLGYYMFIRKQSNARKNSWATLVVGWTLSTGFTLAILFGLYHRHQSLVEVSFYNAFHRTVYALALSWVIYTCLTGQAGPVNKILSYKVFMPLGRLTYSAYLIHPLIITGYFTSLKTPLVFANTTVVTLFLGFLVITYAISLVVSLLFESPIIKLEKFIRNQIKS